jgi:hypothetical protein
MSALGERISAKTTLDAKRVEVAQWGDENGPLVLFATPLSCGDFNKIQRKHPDFLNSMTVEGLVDMVILIAKDAEGNKAFDIADKPVLMRQPVGVVSSVAGELMGDISQVDDAKKD